MGCIGVYVLFKTEGWCPTPLSQLSKKTMEKVTSIWNTIVMPLVTKILLECVTQAPVSTSISTGLLVAIHGGIEADSRETIHMRAFFPLFEKRHLSCLILMTSTLDVTTTVLLTWCRISAQNNYLYMESEVLKALSNQTYIKKVSTCNCMFPSYRYSDGYYMFFLLIFTILYQTSWNTSPFLTWHYHTVSTTSHF